MVRGLEYGSAYTRAGLNEWTEFNFISQLHANHFRGKCLHLRALLVLARSGRWLTSLPARHVFLLAPGLRVFRIVGLSRDILILSHLCICTYLSQTLKYLSKTPCSRQSPEIVRNFLTTMMNHKLTKWETHSHYRSTSFRPLMMNEITYSLSKYTQKHTCPCFRFLQGWETASAEPQATDTSGDTAGEWPQWILSSTAIDSTSLVFLCPICRFLVENEWILSVQSPSYYKLSLCTRQVYQ